MQTVGEVLRAEREKQGISVKDVEKGTSIRALYIQAIEDDNYKVLPGEVYLKGFVRNYASFLGLDPQQLMEVYRQSQEPQPTAQPANPAQQERPRERETKSGGSGGSGGRWLVALLIIVLVAGGAWAAMTYFNQAPVPAKPAPQAQLQSKPAPVPAPAVPAPPQPPAAIPAATPVSITAKYTDSCWTQVTADGQDVFIGIPKVGETLSWNAKQYITLRLGNAAGVDITYNGQPQGKLGGDGDVITKTYGTNNAPNTTSQR